jgi:hypothetical protein
MSKLARFKASSRAPACVRGSLLVLFVIVRAVEALPCSLNLENPRILVSIPCLQASVSVPAGQASQNEGGQDRTGTGKGDVRQQGKSMLTVSADSAY